MIHGFPIEFVRVAIEQTLQKLHNDNPNLVGGKNQIEIHSFYEQLKGQDEVDRFVKTFRDLTEQQNRSGLIANGILMSQENPTITNLYTSMIIPMTWACSLRVKLSDRDLMLETINDLIDELKGSKVDIAELKCIDENGKTYYQPFMVGTMGHNLDVVGINCGDYIGSMGTDTPSSEDFINKINGIVSMGLVNHLTNNDYVYFKGLNTLKVAQVGYNQEIATDEWEIEDNYYDSFGDETTIVNGHVSFKSDEGGFTSVPQMSNPVVQFYLTNGTKHQAFNVSIPLDYDNISLDESGHIVFSSQLFEFEIKTDEWGDFGELDLSIDGLVEEPSTYGFEVIESSDDAIIFPPEHESFEQYKLSMSFDGLRCDTPRTLNGNEYCEISFGGSATLVNSGVKLGNDLIKLYMQKNKILAETNIVFTNATTYYLEPLEMPSGNGANTIPNQLVSNAFKVNTHTDSLTITLQYTFIADDTHPFLRQLFDYGRYGTCGITVNDISPNMIYNVTEWWSSWGVIRKKEYLGKIIESVDIENTESDTLTLTITMQVQGENN